MLQPDQTFECERTGAPSVLDFVAPDAATRARVRETMNFNEVLDWSFPDTALDQFY